MLLVFIATLLYVLLCFLLRDRSRYVAWMSLAASVFMQITLLALITGSTLLAKVQIASALFSVVFGVFLVSYISIGKGMFSKILTSMYLGLWLGGLCIIWHSPVSMEPGILFFSISMGEFLWTYILYVFFFPGLVASFFLFVFGFDNIETKQGLRVIAMSILSATLAFAIYFAVTNPIYGFIALLTNLVWSFMFFLWEVLY